MGRGVISKVGGGHMAHNRETMLLCLLPLKATKLNQIIEHTCTYDSFHYAILSPSTVCVQLDGGLKETKSKHRDQYKMMAQMPHDNHHIYTQDIQKVIFPLPTCQP